MRRVTLRDIALTLGLSVSSVSRALRGSSEIPLSTRRRIQRTAKELGYQPDPMLTALAAYRNAQGPRLFKGTIAYIGIGSDEGSYLSDPETGDLFRGAHEQAQILGYQIRYFRIEDAVSGHRAVGKIMQATGIRGALIRSFPMPLQSIDLPFDRFVCVDLFSEPYTGSVATVSSSHTQSMELVLRRLRRAGFKRPGLVLSKKLSDYLRQGWKGAFTSYGGDFVAASIFLHDGDYDHQLEKWSRDKKVDVLIYGDSENHIFRVRDGKGSIVPAVSMDLLNPDHGMAGIYQNRFRAGVIAMQWLHDALIRENIAELPIFGMLMLPGEWRMGTFPNAIGSSKSTRSTATGCGSRM